MQIRPSQRQTPGPHSPRGGRAPLLHERIAKQRSFNARLLQGSGFALAASLVAWALAAALPYRLLALALTFALGFFWRPEHTEKRAQLWALSWIDARLGLSYRTALELPTQEDPYGLGTAVRRRAEAGAKRLAPPPPQPWWLPPMVLAALFALLPALPVPSLRAPLVPPLSTPATSHGGGETPAPPPPAEPSTAAEPLSGASPETPSEGAADDPAGAAAPEARVGRGAGGNGEGGTPTSDTGEAAALERYLGSLAELEVSDEVPEVRPTSPFGSLSAPPDDLSPEARFGVAEALGGRHLPSPEDAQSGAEPTSQEGASGPSADDPEGDLAGEHSAGEDLAGDHQQGDAAENAGGEGAEDGSGEAPLDPPAAPPPGASEAEGAPSRATAGAEGGLQGDEAADDEAVGEGAAGSPSSPDASGADVGGGGSAETAGAAPSDAAQGAARGGGSEGAADETQNRLGDPPQGPLQRLPSVRSEDGPSQRGEVLQPGAENFVLPSPQEPAEYARAAEEAIREGRLPLEYQDIVREYFR